MRTVQTLKLLLYLLLLGSPVYTRGVATAQTPTLGLEGTASLTPNVIRLKNQCRGTLSGSISGLPTGGTTSSLNLNLFLYPRHGNANGNRYETNWNGTLGDSYDV
jgi:hypothetical protein